MPEQRRFLTAITNSNMGQQPISVDHLLNTHLVNTSYVGTLDGYRQRAYHSTKKMLQVHVDGFALIVVGVRE